MKKNILSIFAGALLSSAASCQMIGEGKVPASVKEAFKRNFPGISGKWEKENKDFEVNFTKEGKEMSLVIDAGGAILETEIAIAVGDLPPAIGSYMKAHYKGMRIKEAARIVKANGEIIYEAALNKKDVLFDSKGNFIKETKD